MGVLLILYGVWNLFHADWLMFVLFTSWGLTFVIGIKGPREMQGIRKILLVVVVVTALIIFLYRG
jgi:hypothetical protein